MSETTYETKDSHTADDIKFNLTKAIEHLTFVRSNVGLIKDTEQRELCFEASNELVAIGVSLQEGLMQAVGQQLEDKPAPLTERSPTSSSMPQSVARPRG